jgi:hypothetical protein
MTSTELFRAGLRLPGASLPPSSVSDLVPWVREQIELADTEDPQTFAGFIAAAHEAAPDAKEWKEEPASVLIDGLVTLGPPQETAEWNGFYLARYAFSGNENKDLAELVRRARHRDGSTAAIVLSSSTCALLESAAGEIPELLAKLAAMGYDPQAVKFGAFHFGAPVLAARPVASSNVASLENAGSSPAAAVPMRFEGGLYPETTAAAPDAIVSQDRPLYAGGPPAGGDPIPTTVVMRADPPEVAPGVIAYADLENGNVVLKGKANLSLSITGGLLLFNSLLETTQKLLIPAEGYLWIDDLDQYAAALVVLDGVLAKRLGLPERSGVYALRAGVETVWLQAELNQSVEQGAQFGRYKATLYKPGSGGAFDEFGNFEDFNVAKFEVAKRVRDFLAALPA